MFLIINIVSKCGRAQRAVWTHGIYFNTFNHSELDALARYTFFLWKKKKKKNSRNDLYTSSYSTELVCGRVQVWSSVYSIILQSRTIPAGDRDACEELTGLLDKHADQKLMTDTWICVSDRIQMRCDKKKINHFLSEFLNYLIKWWMGECIFLMPFPVIPAGKDAVRKSQCSGQPCFVGHGSWQVFCQSYGGYNLISSRF